jgi:hypothetical protein
LPSRRCCCGVFAEELKIFCTNFVPEERRVKRLTANDKWLICANANVKAIFTFPAISMGYDLRWCLEALNSPRPAKAQINSKPRARRGPWLFFLSRRGAVRPNAWCLARRSTDLENTHDEKERT